MSANYLNQQKDHLLLSLHVQPKASRNEICGFHGTAMKMRIKAPPVDGVANKMCLIFLAKTLNLSPKALELVSGQSSRNKIVKITLARPQDLALIAQKIRTLIIKTS